MSGESLVGEDEEVDDDDAMDTDTESRQNTANSRDLDTVVFEGFENNDEDGDEDWEEQNIGSIYERTIGELGDVLGGPPIGIITDDWGVNGTDKERKFAEPDEVIEF